MKKALKIGLLVLALAVAGVLAFAMTKPDSFRVQRSASIKAPPERISAVLSDFQAWKDWSPWEKVDPAMKRTYSGEPRGKGAKYAWAGNSEVGEGSMTITEAQASRVALDLDFVRPFEGHNKVVFTLAPKGDATEVTWDMQGPSPYITKVIQVFCDMDGMIGKQFEAGLSSLRTITEKR
jgi:Polyketide cyclase / dehydrase and lipid transport